MLLVLGLLRYMCYRYQVGVSYRHHYLGILKRWTCKVLSVELSAIACFWPSEESSHSIFAIAISQVSRTLRLESVRNSLRIGREEREDIAPIASAACCK